MRRTNKSPKDPLGSPQVSLEPPHVKLTAANQGKPSAKEAESNLF